MIENQRGTARWAIALGILGLSAIACLGAVSVGRAVAAEPDPESNLSITVDDGTRPTPTPTPTASPSATPTPSGPPTNVPPTSPPGREPERNPGPPSGGVVEQETITEPERADEALGDKPSDLGGILALSGLTASVSPTFGPENGAITLSFVVRNTSSTTFDSTTRFWITNSLGARIADEKHVPVDKLEPDETRRVSVTFSALGQYTVLNGFMQFTPPARVENTQLSKVSRDTLIVLPPLFGLSVAAGVGGLGALLWWWRGGLGVSVATGPLGRRA